GRGLLLGQAATDGVAGGHYAGRGSEPGASSMPAALASIASIVYCPTTNGISTRAASSWVAASTSHVVSPIVQSRWSSSTARSRAASLGDHPPASGSRVTPLISSSLSPAARA